MSLFLNKAQLLLGYKKDSFPKKSHFLKTALLLSFLRLYYATKKKVIRPFYIPIDKLTLYSWRLFAPLNPLHYGEWLDNNYNPPELSIFEREFIKKTIRLFKGNPKNYTGLITTGVSEGNLLSIYLIKDKLIKDGAKKITVLATQLTHDSVFKVSKLANLDITIVDLNEKLGVSATSLEKKILSLRKKGYDGFIISLTLGYKKTGSRDDCDKIVFRMKSLSKRIRTFNYQIFIDAAIDGMVLPFISDSFSPLKDNAIQTITVSLNKLAFVPYPSGLILFNKDLLKGEDNFSGGLLETRSALCGISAWTFFHNFGITGIKKMLLDCHKSRQLFQEKLEKFLGKNNIISPPFGITLSLFLKANKLKKIKRLENIYPLRCRNEMLNINGKKGKFNFVKIYFLPRTKDKVYKEMFFEIKRLLSRK